MIKTFSSALLTAALILGPFAGAAIAKETPKPVQQHNSNAIWFENWIGLTNTLMTISQPGGEITTIFAKSGTPVFQLKGNEIKDGVYRYELKAATEETKKIVNNIDNGRGDAASDQSAVPFYSSGSFVVSRGVIVAPKDIKEE
ncbi:hypothetical protein [Pseudosulfitobacter sp. SM2401]|uniref:hypothetical protein n=1 Tax=Pseudosulfitobacter sp. SM2401 TaxID=3350098 RepID=UPI0036F2F768